MYLFSQLKITKYSISPKLAKHWLQQIRWHKIGSNKYGGKLVPMCTVGNWFQQIQREKTTTRNWFQPIRREINFNQYSGKYFVGNSSNQKGRTFVPINTAGNWFQQIQRENKTTGNWFQPIRRENLCEIVPTNTVCFQFDSK